MSVPYVTDAQVGFFAGQSKQTRSAFFMRIRLKNSSRTSLGTSASGLGTSDDMVRTRQAAVQTVHVGKAAVPTSCCKL